jgi:predicted PurR-regulated permease PerM
VPRVFQGTLQISPFAVLIAVSIGSNLLGIIGAVLALPIAAAIPVIERVWLSEEIPEELAELTGDRPEDEP